jgi:Rod binding domain-containing protein
MDVLPLQPRVNAADLPIEQLAGNPNVSQRDKVDQACKQFEAVLLRQILGEARKTVISSGAEQDSTVSGIYNDMVTSQLADSISRAGTFGLAKSLESQLERQVLPSSPSNPATAPTAASGPVKSSNPHDS